MESITEYFNQLIQIIDQNDWVDLQDLSLRQMDELEGCDKPFSQSLERRKYPTIAGNERSGGAFGDGWNKQWRVCFEWNDGNAFNVEIVDYH